MTTTALVKHEKMSDSPVYRWSTRLFKLYLLIWHRIGIRGADNIPKEGGVILASNHASSHRRAPSPYLHL